MEDFKKKVQHALIDRHMNLTDLANRMGVSLSYVSDILIGNRKSEERIQQIIEILRLDIEDEK